MIEQLSDSGYACGGNGTGVSPLPSNDKQLPVMVKKQALRDLPNENNVPTTKSMGNSTLPKERDPVIEHVKVSGTKRPSSEVNPSLSQAPGAANANGNLVYVRRKTEAEVGKVSCSVTATNSTDLQLSVKAPVSNERVHPSSTLNKPQVGACNIICSPEPSLDSSARLMSVPNESPLSQPLRSCNVMPSAEIKSLISHPVGNSSNTMPSAENKSPLSNPLGKSGNIMASTENKSPIPQPHGSSGTITSSAEKSSPLSRPVGNTGAINLPVDNRAPLPQSLGMSGKIIPSLEQNHIPPASVNPRLDFAKESNTKYLQLRHGQVQTSLLGSDRSAHEDYLQMLRSLSSAELSRLAFELETRTIQLSLEEAREMARMEMLKAMRKPTKPSTSPTALP